MSNLSQISGREDIYYDLSERVKESFKFQYDKQYDVIDTKDTSFRPNQIFLVSLDFSMIDEIMQNKIVNDVQEKLLTIFGLRTLSRDDPNYKGSYIGPYNKDIAYHNGTVWPWLLGPFIKAFLKVRNYDYSSRKYAYNNFLQPMLEVFDEKWDGSIYEIFDGDPVYAPRGCISQAWSVAEILRAWVEDINYIPPINEKIFESPEICI
jgi:glycogen debranching enzyme